MYQSLIVTTLYIFYTNIFSVIQQLFNKKSTFSSKKLGVLDKKFAQNAQNYPQKRVQNGVKRVTSITC